MYHIDIHISITENITLKPVSYGSMNLEQLMIRLFFPHMALKRYKGQQWGQREQYLAFVNGLCDTLTVIVFTVCAIYGKTTTCFEFDLNRYMIYSFIYHPLSRLSILQLFTI